MSAKTEQAWPHPVGTPVVYHRRIGPRGFLPHDRAVVTVTRSDPWELASGHVVVKLAGISGGCSVEHCVMLADDYGNMVEGIAALVAGAFRRIESANAPVARELLIQRILSIGALGRRAELNTIRQIIRAHLKLLANARDKWPELSPSTAVSHIDIGEAAIMDHIEEIAQSLNTKD